LPVEIFPDPVQTMFLRFQLSFICIGAILSALTASVETNPPCPPILSIVCDHSLLVNDLKPDAEHIEGLYWVHDCNGSESSFYNNLVKEAHYSIQKAVSSYKATTFTPSDETVVAGVGFHAKTGTYPITSITDMEFEPKYPMVMDKDSGCVQVKIQRSYLLTWYVTFFCVGNELKPSLYIHNCCDPIVYGGVLGSMLDEETLEFRKVFSELKLHKNFEKVMKNIRQKFVNDGYQLEDAMRLASIGLQHNKFEVKRIHDIDEKGVIVEGKSNIWCITVKNEDIVYSVTEKA
jgi:hypothetical protein